MEDFGAYFPQNDFRSCPNPQSSCSVLLLFPSLLPSILIGTLMSLYKYFKRKDLPTSEETEIVEKATKVANIQ